MKTNGRIVVFLTLFALLVPLGAWAKSPDPFANPSKDMSVKARYTLMASLPADAPARTEFFAESLKNTGLSEQQLTELVNTGMTKVIYCTDKTCKLETAGLLNGKATYWRNVNEKEPVVIIAKGDWWVPWFLLGCNNPVRPIMQGKPITATPAPPPPVVVETPVAPSGYRVKQMQCVQQFPIYIASATTLYERFNSHQFYGLYTPTRCIEFEETIIINR